MKTLASSIAILAASVGSLLAYSLTISLPASPTTIARAWQGNATTVAQAFANNTVAGGTTLYLWNFSSQTWQIITYEFGEWSNPNYVLKNTEGFLLKNGGSARTITLNGPDTPGTLVQVTLQPNKWHFLGFAYPRAGWLEKPNPPYSPTCNLNFPGRYKTYNNNKEDEYYRWGLDLDGLGWGEDWYFTRRSSDSPGVSDPDNPTGGYTTNPNDCPGPYGARWRNPGQTTDYQLSGFGSNWIYIGRPIFIRPETTSGGSFVNRVWKMYKTNDVCTVCN